MKPPKKIVKNLSYNALLLKPIDFTIQAITEEIGTEIYLKDTIIKRTLMMFKKELTDYMDRMEKDKTLCGFYNSHATSVCRLYTARICYGRLTKSEFSKIKVNTWIVTLRNLIDLKYKEYGKVI